MAKIKKNDLISALVPKLRYEAIQVDYNLLKTGRVKQCEMGVAQKDKHSFSSKI
jgi:hypothetical protein